MKRLLAFILSVSMIFSGFPVSAFAQKTEEIEPITMTHINPLYEDVVDEEDLVQPSGIMALEDVEYHDTVEAAGAELKEGLKDRLETVVVGIYQDEWVADDVKALGREIFYEAFVHTGVPTEGDYLRWQWDGYHSNISGSYIGNKVGVTYTFTITYKTSAEQEQIVDETVVSLLDELDVEEATDYETVKAIYDWICSNVTYDYENLENDEYILKYSAYAALIDRTAVCQGYALLLYRLLLEEGIDTRLIAGIGNGGAHGWNIVQLDGAYYNADSTWDAGRTTYGWFLLNQENFTDHSRNDEYSTEEFMAEYPMGETNYEPKIVETVANGTCGDSLNWKLDSEGVLTVSGTGAMYNYNSSNMPWYSYKNSIFSVVVGEGATSIGNYAFAGANNVSKVSFPETLETIGRDAFNSCKIESVQIPDSVVSIDVNAFTNNSPLTEVDLGNGLKILGDNAFYACSGLTSIVLPASLEVYGLTPFGSSDNSAFAEIIVEEGNKYFTSKNGVLYNKDKTTLISVPSGKTGEFTIPDTVIKIENAAFDWCTGLTEISISDSVTTIGQYAFRGCQGLAALEIPDSVTTMGSYTFNGCQFTKVKLSANCPVIPEYAFMFCSALQEVEIPEGVVRLENCAFGMTIALEYVEIPSTVTYMGVNALACCNENLTVKFAGSAPEFGADSIVTTNATIYYPANDDTWTDEVKTFVITGVTGAINWISYDTNILVEGTCGENTTWTLGKDGLLTISGTGDMESYSSANGQPWHDYADSITSVLVEGTVNSVGAYAFYQLNNLTKVVIEEGVTAIGGHSMKYCTNLDSVIIPSSVTEMGVDVFYASNKLTIAGPIGGDYHIQFGWTETIPAKAFHEFYGLTNVVLPETITTIGEKAFLYCDGLKGIELPDGLEVIGDQAFENSGLTSITIPGTVKAIRSEAFENCTDLTSVILEEGIETIGYKSFGGCTGLTDLELPSTIINVESYAFEKCTSLNLVFTGDAPEFGTYAFDDCENLVVHFPGGNPTWTDSVMQDYKAVSVKWVADGVVASGWSGATTWRFADNGIMIINGTGNMKNYGYVGGQPWTDYADQIKAVVVQDGVTAVGSGAFKDLTELESVTLPDSGLKKIGEAAFYGCTSLKEIHIPDSIYTIFDYTFKGCTSLENVRLSKILIKVGQGAFENCTSLDYIYIPGNTEIIGSWSFKGCTALTEVDMTWADATEIREGAFKNCSALTTIHLPGNIQVLGDSCFYGIGANSFTVPGTVTKVEPWCFARAYSLTEVIFEGDAPTIGEGAFNKITLTAYYPMDNVTWTADIMQNYGGTVTWQVK